MQINIKKLNPDAVVPTRGSEYSAGYDLYACIEQKVFIEPHKTVKIGTGLSMELPNGYYGEICARSGIATKKSLRPANCVGVCDEDYRGEYIVALHNDSDDVQTVEPNERIAQFILKKYDSVEFTVVDTLNETNRGVGGFGSTGK